MRLTVQDNFSGALNRYNQALQTAAKGSSAFGQANAVIGNAMNAWSSFNSLPLVQFGKAAVGVLEDLNAIGAESLKAKTVFEQLTGGTEQAAFWLEAMRASTSGVVSDMQLMQAGSKFLQMGLADTSDEAARFTEIAVKLGATMGHDVHSSIENFTLMLANQSILRLDTYGISGSKVRDRMRELRSETEGMTKEQAFLQATLEQGGLALDRLGDSADAGATNLAKMQTTLENIKTTLGEIVAMGLESVLTNPLTAAPGFQAAAANAAAMDDAISSLETQFSLMAEFSEQAAEMELQSLTYTEARASAAARIASIDKHRAFMVSEFERQSLDNAGKVMQILTANAEDMASNRRVQEMMDGMAIDMQSTGMDIFRDQWKEVAASAVAMQNAVANAGLSELLGQGSGGAFAELGNLVLGQMGGSPEEQAAMQERIALASGEQTMLGQFVEGELAQTIAQMGEQFGSESVVAALERVETTLRDSKLAGLSDAQTIAALHQAVGFRMGGEGQQFTVGSGDNPTSVAARYGMTPEQVMQGAGAANAYSLMPGTYGMGGGLVPVGGAMHGGFFSGGSVAGAGFGGTMLPGMQGAEAGTMPGVLQEGANPVDIMVNSMIDLNSKTEDFSSSLAALPESVSPTIAALDDVSGQLNQLSSRRYTITMDVLAPTPEWLSKLGISLDPKKNGGVVPGTDARGKTPGFNSIGGVS